MDDYAILGIKRGATEAEVKAAFTKAAHKHHPDKGGDVKEFIKAKDARDRILKDLARGGGRRADRIFVDDMDDVSMDDVWKKWSDINHGNQNIDDIINEFWKGQARKAGYDNFKQAYDNARQSQHDSYTRQTYGHWEPKPDRETERQILMRQRMEKQREVNEARARIEALEKELRTLTDRYNKL